MKCDKIKLLLVYQNNYLKGSIKHHAQYVLQKKRQFTLEVQLLTPLTFKKDNLYALTLTDIM